MSVHFYLISQQQKTISLGRNSDEFFREYVPGDRHLARDYQPARLPFLELRDYHQHVSGCLCRSRICSKEMASSSGISNWIITIVFNRTSERTRVSSAVVCSLRGLQSPSLPSLFKVRKMLPQNGPSLCKALFDYAVFYSLLYSRKYLFMIPRIGKFTSVQPNHRTLKSLFFLKF